MKPRKGSRSSILGLGIALAILGVPRVLVAEVADLVVAQGHAEWTPRIEADELVLRIASPYGLLSERRFTGNSSPSVAFENREDWPDGVYIWEMIGRRAGLPVESSYGAFWILGGHGVPNGLRDGEDPGLRSISMPGQRSIQEQDQQIGDDLIVTGDACVGTACVNGEAFTANDTLWLKQQVGRLKFDDTSGAGMPANDWELVANDPGSSGANKFTIKDVTGNKEPFTVIAGAPSNSIFVDVAGKVGLGTATPSRPLHIVTAGNQDPAVEVVNSGPARFRFTNANTAESWNFGHQSPSGTGLVFSDVGDAFSEMLLDVSGNLDLLGSFKLGAGAWRLTPGTGPSALAIDDLVAGSTPVQVRAGTPANAMVIGDGLGNSWIGLGTATPMAKLHLFAPATVDVFAGMGPDLANGPGFNYGYAGGSFGRSAGFFNIRPDAGAAAPNPSLRFATANVQHMIIDNQGYVGLCSNCGVPQTFDPSHPIHHRENGAHLTAGGAWSNGSSRDSKEGIESLTSEEALKTLVELAPVKFRYKVEREDQRLGFIAEDVPELVADPGRKTLSPMDVIAVLARVVQDQQAVLANQGRLIQRLQQSLPPTSGQPGPRDDGTRECR